MNLFAQLFERRSVSTSAELLDFLRKGSESVAGTSVNESTALNVSTVMTCVSLISRTVASLPLQVYERSSDGAQRFPATDHPVTGVLREPNPWQTMLEFVQVVQTQALLRGNGYAWVNWTTNTRDGSEQVKEMIPLHPDRVRVEQLDDYTLRYVLERPRNGSLVIPQDEMLHLRGLSTDGYMGRDPLRDARDIVGVALATQEYAGSFWRNDATPTVALKHPKTLSEKARKNLEESFAATYGGGRDRRRVAVLEEGVDLTPITLNAEQSQFLETRKFQRSEIASWFHVPPHMIGDTEKSTSWGTGIEQQQIGFMTFTIRPWLTAWEQRLNRILVKNESRFYCKFTLDGWLRGDINSRYMAYSRGIQGGWLSPNDVRRLEDMNPITGGDVYLAPTNLAPLTSLPDVQPQADTVKAMEEFDAS